MSAPNEGNGGRRYKLRQMHELRIEESEMTRSVRWDCDFVRS